VKRAVQAKCPTCGNRPRLTPGHVVECRDLLHAEHVKAARQAESDGMEVGE